eukprot:GHVS01102674.1.p1 GENE.GHVS01102674.1~~GHVS01102674.1.p1  ORF type:complete len:524 (-),score=64.12 GHVS01102674.1:134-1705(-)
MSYPYAWPVFICFLLCNTFLLPLSAHHPKTSHNSDDRLLKSHPSAVSSGPLRALFEHSSSTNVSVTGRTDISGAKKSARTPSVSVGLSDYQYYHINGVTSFLVSPFAAAVAGLKSLFGGETFQQEVVVPSVEKHGYESTSTVEQGGSPVAANNTGISQEDVEERVNVIVDSLTINEIPPMHNTPNFPSDINPDIPKLLVARIVGNNMPPLQGKTQHLINAKRIIEQGRRQSVGEHRLWVVNTILVESEKTDFVDLLEKHKEWYVEIPVEFQRVQAILKEVEVPIMHSRGWWLLQRAAVCVTNLNAARNLVVKVASEMGYDWSMVLDGNVFITQQGIDGVYNAIHRATHFSKKSYVFIPFYRLINETDSTLVTATASFTNLQPSLTGRQEGQLLVGTNGELGLEPFSVSSQYGANDKFSLMGQLMRKRLYDPDCKIANVAYHSSTTSPASDLKLVTNCGYVIRLPYWSGPPETERIAKLLNGAVFGSASRRDLRQMGMNRIKKEILARVDLPLEVKKVLDRSLH